MRLVGTIVKPQGVKGELKIYPADKNLDIYENLKDVYIDNENYTIKNLSRRQGFLYVLLKGVDNRNIAETFRQKKVYANDDEMSLKENMYYVDDLSFYWRCWWKNESK